MKHLLPALVLTAAALPAAAQDLAQSADPWFTRSQAAVEARMAVVPNTARAKNVILFVADGNGVGTNYATRLFEGQKAGGLGDDFVQPHEAFPYSALVKTYSTNGQTPDSAPTATALNAGIKTKNDLINIPDSVAVNDCAAGLATETTLFSDIATAAGKSVGVVSTARITHATPAATYARTVNRDWEDISEIPEGCAQKDIAVQLLDAMAAGTVDVALGGGRQHFLPTGTMDDEGKEGKRTDGRNLIDEAKAAGAQVVFADTDFAGLKLDGSAPVLGLFESSHMKYDADREGEPSLADMTEAAVKTLSTNPEGFYLTVEAGRVDHANHDGNLYRTVTDGAAFNEAVRRTLALVNPAETLVIVTADHEHAIAFNGYCGRGSSVTGLCMEIDEAGVANTGTPELADDGKPYTVAGYLNGPGSILATQPEGANALTRPEVTAEDVASKDYLQQAMLPKESETHSGEDVAAYAVGPWAHLVSGTIEQNELFQVMRQAISAK